MDRRSDQDENLIHQDSRHVSEPGFSFEAQHSENVKEQARIRRHRPSQTTSELAHSLESNYRMLPLMIGCIVPVSILINVPSITSPWVGVDIYNSTTMEWEDTKEIDTPRWMSSMVVVALVMAIICNICVLFRFLERHIWHSTILSLITASAQDVLSIGAIIPFCILYPPSKYVYLEGFWTMIASMAFSLTATVLMSIDLHSTPNFRLQGSGVTHKQRILIAEAMTLCFYLAIGAMIFIYIEKWTFSDSMFFVLVSITTIGFGDKVPKTTAGRVFVLFYGAGGIVLLALAVNAIRYVILEDLHRRFAVHARERKAKREARRQERKELQARAEEKRRRYLEAVERIRQMESKEVNESGTIDVSGPHYFTHLPHRFTIHSGTHLRIPTFFSRPPESAEAKQTGGSDSTLTSNVSTPEVQQDAIEILHPDPKRLEGPASGAMLTFEEQNPRSRMAHTPNMPDVDLDRFMTMDDRPPPKKSLFRRLFSFGRTKTEITIGAYHSPEKQRELERQQAHQESMEEYGRRLRFSAAMFLTFWFGGAVIFMLTESWTFFDSLYFCGISFATIGYGDFVPHTPTGRSIFIAYCLIGVVTLTSLASLMSEVLSKSMRRHVVETQLRRSERIEALGKAHNSDENRDLEHSTTGSISAEEEADFQKQMQTLNNFVQEASEEGSAKNKSCQGSLQQVVNVSRDFDALLQKVLGLDSAITEDASNATTSKRSATPKTIRDYIEKSDQDDADPSYLSPSISRDISTTSSIHRHSLRPAAIRPSQHYSPDIRGGSSNTYHGTGYSSSSDSSQLKITAWPTISQSPKRLNSCDDNPSSPSPPPLVQSPDVSAPGGSPVLRHTKQGTVTLSAAQWHHLIEYSKQLKGLVETCEAAVQKVAAWEANEKRLRLKRRKTRQLQLRALNERRRRLQEDDLDEDDELEVLEAWEEEGSQDEEEDEEQDRHRSKISATLLGTLSPKRGRSPSRRRSSRRSSMQEGSNSGPRFDPNFLQPPVVNLHIRGRPQAQSSYSEEGLNTQDMSPHPRRKSSRTRDPSRTRQKDILSSGPSSESPSGDSDTRVAPDALPDPFIEGTILVSSPPGSPKGSRDVV